MVWATDFLPLPYADGAAPLGEARIFRLRLPNSALASLGLPVTSEDVPREITADVLVSIADNLAGIEYEIRYQRAAHTATSSVPPRGTVMISGVNFEHADR